MIEIQDKPIALIIQIDPNAHTLMEIILKTEYAIPGHTGVRDIWFQGTKLEDRENAQALIDAAIKELLDA